MAVQNRDVPTYFLQGKNVNGYGALYSKDNILYSYATPIAFIQGNTVLINPDKYSSTTSKQQGYLRTTLTANGFHATTKYNISNMVKVLGQTGRGFPPVWDLWERKY